MRLLSFILLMLTMPAFAQGSKADYERALSLDKRTQNKVFRDAVTPHWLEGGDTFWYRVATGPGEHEFVFVNAAQGERRPAFDHEKLARALGEKLGQPVAPHRLPFSSIAMAPDGSSVRFRAGSKTWRFDANGLQGSDEPLAEATLPAAREVHPSRRTGDETAIIFINR